MRKYKSQETDFLGERSQIGIGRSMVLLLFQEEKTLTWSNTIFEENENS